MIFVVFIQKNLNGQFLAGDRNQLFLEVEDVEAEDHRGVAEVEVFVAGDLRGVAEDLRGVVAVVASGAEGDFRVTLCNISIALPISRCHYFRMLRAHKSHTFMLVLVVTCGFVYVYVYLAEEFELYGVNYRCLF
jgi:hypothetical protein